MSTAGQCRPFVTFFCQLLESSWARINWIRAVDQFGVEQLICCQKCRANDCRAIEFWAVHPHSTKDLNFFFFLFLRNFTLDVSLAAHTYEKSLYKYIQVEMENTKCFCFCFPESKNRFVWCFFLSIWQPSWLRRWLNISRKHPNINDNIPTQYNTKQTKKKFLSNC